VRLQLHVLAYNLGNYIRALAMPDPIKDWQLTSLTEKLIKIGAKVISHGRYMTFQLAEGRGIAADVRRHPVPVDHRPAAGASRACMTGRSGETGQIITAEVRLNQRFFRASARPTGRFDRLRRVRCQISLSRTPDGAILPDNHSESEECRITPVTARALDAQGPLERLSSLKINEVGHRPRERRKWLAFRP
jgi:hypothetical protein